MATADDPAAYLRDRAIDLEALWDRVIAGTKPRKATELLDKLGDMLLARSNAAARRAHPTELEVNPDDVLRKFPLDGKDAAGMPFHEEFHAYADRLAA